MTTTPMNMIQALNSALDIKMTEDPNVLSFGEDAGYFGGVFRVTDHLQKKHGLTRSFDVPISECGIVAAAIGMGAYGLRPVVEIQFADYIYLWRRHLRRPDPQPVAGKPVHPYRRPEGRHPLQSRGRQGPADRSHRGR